MLGVYFISPVRTILLVLLLTLLCSVILSAPVDYLYRWGIARPWGLLIVLAALSVAGYFVGASLFPVFESQALQLVDSLPALLSEMQGFAGRLEGSLDLGVSLDPDWFIEAGRSWLSTLSVGTVLSLGSGLTNLVSLAGVVLLTSVYAVLHPAPLLNGFTALFSAGRRSQVRATLEKLYRTVQDWFLGQLTEMTIIAVLSTTALYLIGIPFALLLGVFSGLISFIPFVGPVISVLPPVLLGLTGGAPLEALWVVVAYFTIQQVESDITYPLVMNRAVELQPAIIIFALFVAGTLFGFAGLLIAVPLVAALHVLVDELWISKMNRAGDDGGAPYGIRKLPRRRPGILRRTLRSIRASRSM